MATLVLGVVGGIVGGPVGAAIGGLIGNAVDHAVLRPAGREGPRLADLAVQTSRYGQPIPRVFGTMRVAGTVIWATDLQEARATEGGGKGQPSVTSYSYSASFAVALSSRRVVSVGRIWADGNLLRGAEGDWKSAVTFRLHVGGEDQAADPLIASLEGAGQTPAHRGFAYAVFEDLQLADFGNRIPSLTFEVTADAGTPSVAAIAREIGGGAIAADEGAATLGGFSAYGESARGTAALLAQAACGWFGPTRTGVRLYAGEGAAVEIADAGYGEGAPGRRAVRALGTVPRTLTLAHYDPARDWQTGAQTVSRTGAGTRAERIELPAALGAGEARTLAAGLLARAEAERVRRTVSLDAEAAGIAPGERVRIAGEAGTWRIAEAMFEGMVATLTLLPLARAPLPLGSSSGRVLPAPDRPIGATVVHAFELPNLDDTLLGQPRVLVAAAGTGAGWRRAALLRSLDEGASWTPAGSTAMPAVMGVVAVPPGAGSAALYDLANTLEVELLHDGMALAGADAARMDQGGNLAVVGDELIQFGNVVPLSPTRWRLSRLLRARRAVPGGPHLAGERFVLLEADALVSLPVPASAVGGRLRLLASGTGDTAGAATAEAAITGASVAPPAPVRLRSVPIEGGGARVTWVRRSRLGWDWADGGDAPLGEERESYRVEVDAGGATRSAVVGVPEVGLTAAEVSDGARVAVRQLGTLAASGESVITVGAGG